MTGTQPEVAAPAAAPARSELWMKVRRVIWSDGSGRSPGLFSSASISRARELRGRADLPPPGHPGLCSQSVQSVVILHDGRLLPE